MRRHRIPVILVALAVAGLLAAGCSSPPEAGSTTTVSYLWVVNSEGGTITGSGDAGLTLTLTGVRDYATQFADRPVRHAYVLSTTDFADRWEQWFSLVTPNAVLSFTEPGSPMPASIVLEVTDPVYDKAARTLVFDAARLHREPDPHPDAVEAIALPNVPTPATFMSGALFIDSAGDGSLPEPDASDTTATTDSACRWGDCPTGWAAGDGGFHLHGLEGLEQDQDATTSPAPPVPETATPFAEEPEQEEELAAAAAAPAAKPAKKPAAQPATYSIGDTGPGGGIVFYDAGSVRPWGRYLEAAPDRWSGRALDPEVPWCYSDTDVWTSTVIGAGAANTNAMLAGCPSGAANSASGYRGGGLTDWFLPSRDELNELHGFWGHGLTGNFYWSSSQNVPASAWYQDFSRGFSHGISNSRDTHSRGSIRPVRAF
jgi:hypothetical protein